MKKTEITELSIPQEMREEGVTRIAVEYGTLCLTYKNRVFKSTFYSRNIDKTMSAIEYILYHNMRNHLGELPLSGQVRDFISENWLTLIGKSTQQQMLI